MRIVGSNQCVPTPTRERSIVPNAHRVPPPHKWSLPTSKQRAVKWTLGHNIFYLKKKNEIENKNRRNKESIKTCKKENKNYIQQDRIGITLKEHPGRVDLPVPHYSPDGQSTREMALGAGH